MKLKQKLPLIVLTGIISSPAFALTDVYFDSGNWEIDSQGSPPLHLGGPSGEAVNVYDKQGDLSEYHVYFDNYKNNGDSLRAVLGGNSSTPGDPSASIPGFIDYTFGAITFENYTSGLNRLYSNGSFEVANPISITVNGDMRFVDNNATFWIGDQGAKYIDVKGQLYSNSGSVTIGTNGGNEYGPQKAYFGSIKLEGNTTLAMDVGKHMAYGVTISPTIGTFEDPDVEVSGIVEMGSETKWLISSSNYRALNTYYKIGGLSGEGFIGSGNVANGEAGTSKIVMAITANAGEVHEFNGIITSGEFSWGSNDNSRHLTIQMLGEADSVQIIRTKLGNENNNRQFFNGNIEVYSGTLLFGNTNDLRGDMNPYDEELRKCNQLLLAGGKFGSTGQSADSSVAGDAYFNDIIWNGGSIIVDVWSEDNFSIIYADTLTLGDAETFMFEFINGTGSDLSDIILNVNDFMQISDGITEEQIAKMAGYSTDGQWQAIFNAQNGSVSFVQVPEASEIAAIFGAMALAFAAFRRRK